RQASQKCAELEALELVTQRPPKAATFVYSKNFHRGVIGLVATRLCQDFGLPAFVGSLAKETGLITGSARMPEGLRLNCLDAMATASDILEQFGGHAMAAGFELKERHADEFRSRLEDFFFLKAAALGPRTWLYDVEASLAD